MDSIGFLSDEAINLPDPGELGYHKPRPKLPESFCRYCRQKILWGTDVAGRSIPLQPTKTQGKWVYRLQLDGTYRQAGTGPGHARHRCNHFIKDAV